MRKRTREEKEKERGRESMSKTGEMHLDERENARVSYLKEAGGHGSTWHSVVRRHVAHHWTGRRSCTLQHRGTETHT